MAQEKQESIIRDRGRDAGAGLGLTLERETLARLDRLRCCIGQSRSKVTDLALTKGGLDGVERLYAARVRRFNDYAKRMGFDSWRQCAQQYAVTYSRLTYPPTIDQLEDSERSGAFPAETIAVGNAEHLRGVAQMLKKGIDG